MTQFPRRNSNRAAEPWSPSAHAFLAPICWFVVAWIAAGCGQEADHPEQPIRAIKWHQVESTDRHEIRRIAGTVKPTDESRLSFEVTGRVERVAVQLGDRVEAGDLLASLEPAPFQILVRNAEARLTQAEAERWRQQAEFQRYRRMLDRDVVSQSDFDRVRAAHDSSVSASRAAQAQLDLARRNLRKSKLVAPFSGVVSEKRIDPFVEVEAGRPVFELDGESEYEVELALPEPIAMKSRPGDAVSLRFPTLNDLMVAGTIKAIGSRAGVADAFPAKLRIEDPPSEIRAGMTAEAEFSLAASPQGASESTAAEAPLLQVPIASLLAQKDSRYAVFVYDHETNRVKKTPVEVRDIRANRVLVEDGIAAGAIVAAAGVEFLTDGQPVILMASDAR